MKKLRVSDNDLIAELLHKKDRTRIEEALFTLWDELMGYEYLAAEAARELAAKNEAIESGVKALRAVIHDRPTAHSDAVWQTVNEALAKLEMLK